MRWSLPYSDVTQHLDQVGKVYAVYDPYTEQDRLHIERIQHPNLVPLKAIGLGHKSAMVLRRMDQLKPIMSGAIKGTLTQSEFYQPDPSVASHLSRAGCNLVSYSSKIGDPMAQLIDPALFVG